MKEVLKILLALLAWFAGVVMLLGLMITTAALDFFADVTEGRHERRKDKKS